MSKKRILPVFIIALFLFATAAFFSLAKGTFAKAEEAAELYGKVESQSCFTVEGKTLNKVTVPESVTGYFEVVIPSGVETIAGGAFKDAQDETALRARLISVVIPAEVKSISENAFVDCDNLKEVCLLNEELASKLKNTGLDNVKSVVTEEKNKTLKTVKDGNNSYLTVRGGEESWLLLAHRGTDKELELPKASVLNPQCKTYSIYAQAFEKSQITSVILPECVTEIGESAFSGSKLTSVKFNGGLTKIGAQAFFKTDVEALSFPETLKEIGANAFYGCAKLTDAEFKANENEVVINYFAFGGCTALKLVKLPQKAKIGAWAFDGCSSLLWVYAGKTTAFEYNGEDADAAFFPKNENITIVFPDLTSYTNALKNETFKTANGASATYTVNINFIIEGGETKSEQRLHGKPFNFVKDGATGFWNTETSITDLPAQAENYASTVWYGEAELKNAASIKDVNEWLLSDREKDISLYCYQTIAQPVLPEEPASWVFSNDKAYAVNNLSEVLKALGCEQKFSKEQLSALKFNVTYADEKGNPVAEVPAEIKEAGAYSVSISLDSKYGVWTKPALSGVTVNVNTGSFNVVLIVFLVIGILAVAATVSTAVIRKKVQAKNKKKQLSSQEVLEKFRAAGGETTLK